MLYDNAQLLELLALAHAHRPDPLYAARAAETVGVDDARHDRERVAGRAAFAASEDADSEGEEGKLLRLDRGARSTRCWAMTRPRSSARTT